MCTMRFADEIVDRKQIEAIPGRTKTPDARGGAPGDPDHRLP